MQTRWEFQVVRLWEIPAATVLDQGPPGLLALLPLMRGGSDLDLVKRAVQRLERAIPGEPMSTTRPMLVSWTSTGADPPGSPWTPR